MSAIDSGNFNMKGKKSLRLRCGCCTIYNLKDECRKKEDLKYIRVDMYKELDQAE